VGAWVGVIVNPCQRFRAKSLAFRILYLKVFLDPPAGYRVASIIPSVSGGQLDWSQASHHFVSYFVIE
jgi:hypothetical protein